MKRMLFVLLLTGCAGASVPKVSLDLGSTVPPSSGVQQAMLDAVNAARSVARDCKNSNGSTTHFEAAQGLKLNARLTLAAQYHAQDMASRNFFDHTGSKGDSSQLRIESAGYVFAAIGENIGKIKTASPLELNASIQNVMQAWLASTTGHCQTLMNPSSRELGVGFAENTSTPDRYYWVQDFGTPQ